MKKRVLCLFVDGVEETELVTPVNVLRRAGVEVVLAGLYGGTVHTKGGMQIVSEVGLDEVEVDGFDLLLIPGGPGVMELRKDGRAAVLAGEFAAKGRTVAAICAAPLILLDAGLLEGRKFTAHDSVHAMLPGVVDERVVQDGQVVTSRGPGTALDFGLVLVERLLGAEAAAKVAREIMA